jgi:signal transduction histidine kinase
MAGAVEPYFSALIDDFYAEIERHPDAQRVITGGAEQVTRLKGTLLGWLRDLFSGCYDQEYVNRRWSIGRRHVEIGLRQAFPDAALSRLRHGLVRAVREGWTGNPLDLARTVESLNALLDLELAIIHEAYEYEYMARIQRIERLAAIGQVAGGIAHELRNPLNAIKTSAYFLNKARQLSTEKFAEHLGRIDRQVSLADGVITTLSSFAKLPVPELRPVVVIQCVEETLKNHPTPDSITVRLDFPESLPKVDADPQQLQIVFGNLIRNAQDAMPDGGRLTISARQTENNTVNVAFADTGTGIAPEHLHQVMEPLFSTKARGIGLGLAISRSIMEKHEGQLRAESTPGNGSIFTVTLKMAKG